MSYTNDSKPTSTYDDLVDFLLQESLSFLLLETGDKIVLDQSEGHKPNNTFSSDTKPSNSYTNDSK